MKRTFLSALAIAAVLAGCDDEIRVGRPAPNAPGPSDPAAVVEADGGVPDGGPTVEQYRDEDFVEADNNRDPFRNYAAIFQAVPPPPEGGRDVRMPDTGIEEMRLIGIVSGVADPRAMLVDRNGMGHTVRRGEYVGRPEVVQAGGTEDLSVTLNWRVDRIRPNEIVLTRDDPTAPNRPPLTRVLALREADEEAGIEPR
jgi:type IV pilus assembly protein PilP